MRVVFLDVDGVLNYPEIWGNFPREDALCERACKRVQSICDQTGAVIVLSSTWRLAYELPDVRGWLKAKGLTADLIDRTPALRNEMRGEEIAEWLSQAGKRVESFVILDDDSDMLPVMDKLVQTEWAHGIQDEHVAKAVALLVP